MAKAKVCVITSAGKRVCGRPVSKASGAPAKRYTAREEALALLNSNAPIRTKKQVVALVRLIGDGARIATGSEWPQGRFGIERPAGAGWGDDVFVWGIYGEPKDGYRQNRLGNVPYMASRVYDRITDRLNR